MYKPLRSFMYHSLHWHFFSDSWWFSINAMLLFWPKNKKIYSFDGLFKQFPRSQAQSFSVSQLFYSHRHTCAGALRQQSVCRCVCCMLRQRQKNNQTQASPLDSGVFSWPESPVIKWLLTLSSELKLTSASALTNMQQGLRICYPLKRPEEPSTAKKEIQELEIVCVYGGVELIVLKAQSLMRY